MNHRNNNNKKKKRKQRATNCNKNIKIEWIKINKYDPFNHKKISGKKQDIITNCFDDK